MQTNVGIICDSDISSQKESDDDIQACSMFFILLDGTEIPGDSLLKSCTKMALTIPPRQPLRLCKKACGKIFHMVLSICPQDTKRSEAEWKFNGGQRAEAHLIIVADAADIVCRAKNFMWTPHCAILHHINKLFVMWSYWWLLHMKNFQWTPSSHDLRLLMFWRKINFVAIYFYDFTFAGAGAGDRFFSKTSTPQYFGC